MFYYNYYLKQYSQQLRKAGNLAEVLLWNELKKDKLKYRFLRQKPINRYIVDFYCPVLKLAVEIDGSIHNYKMQEDKNRQKNIESIGIKVVRFLDSDVRYNLEGVIENIKLEILRLSRATSFSKEE